MTTGHLQHTLKYLHTARSCRFYPYPRPFTHTYTAALHILFQCQWSHFEEHGHISHGKQLERINQTKQSTIKPCQCKWRHNGRDRVLNHQLHHCLLNRLFRCRSKKTSKLRVTGLCAGNSPVTGEFPAHMASNAENVSIWWRHHTHIYGLYSITRVSFWRHRSFIAAKEFGAGAWQIFF